MRYQTPNLIAPLRALCGTTPAVAPPSKRGSTVNSPRAETRARIRLVEQGGVPDQLAMLVQLGRFDPPRAPEPAAAADNRSPRSDHRDLKFSSANRTTAGLPTSWGSGRRGAMSSACTGRAITFGSTGGRLR